MFCSNCGRDIQNATVCPYCGKEQGNRAASGAAPQGTAPQGNPVPQGNPMLQGGPAPQYYTNGGMQEPYDHTKEFAKKDISDNKVIAMVAYLLGTVGVIIAFLAARDSAYAGFHARQSMKITICNYLIGVVSVVLCWTFIVPIAGIICFLVLLVVRIICFVGVCMGTAKEPVIIRSLGFLK